MGKPELEDCVIEGANRLGLVVGIVLGCAAALATEGWTLIPNSAAIIIPFLPGFYLSGFAARIHAFPLSVAACGNFGFWLLLCWLIGVLIGRIGRNGNNIKAQG